jgi:homoserine dehydrogenase
VAFGGRVDLEDVLVEGIAGLRSEYVRAAGELGMVVRLVGAATLVDGRFDVRVQPAFVHRHHPLAAVEGAFNAVMLQGDAIREITLEGPGAGGIETASAVVADLVSIVGTEGTGFLQDDPVRRTLERLPPGEIRSEFYVHLEVEDRPGVLAHVAEQLAEADVSIARLTQRQTESGAALDLVTHESAAGAIESAVARLEALGEVQGRPAMLRVISERGV